MQTEPKLHPETANMEFEKVTANQSATLKAGLKANLESKRFLRRCSYIRKKMVKTWVFCRDSTWRSFIPTKIGKLRNRWKEQQGAKERHT
jgi:hypothetical protein